MLEYVIRQLHKDLQRNDPIKPYNIKWPMRLVCNEYVSKSRREYLENIKCIPFGCGTIAIPFNSGAKALYWPDRGNLHRVDLGTAVNSEKSNILPNINEDLKFCSDLHPIAIY